MSQQNNNRNNHNNPPQGNATSPSGVSAIDVVLGKSNFDSAKNIEELIAKSISITILGGNTGSNVKDLNTMKSKFGKDGLLSNLFTTHKILNKIDSRLATFFGGSKLRELLFENSQLYVGSKLDKIIDILSKQTPQTDIKTTSVDILFDKTPDFEKIADDLEKIASSGKELEILSKAVSNMSKYTGKLDSLRDNLDNITKALVVLSHHQAKTDELEKIIDVLTKISAIKFGQFPKLDKYSILVDGLNQISGKLDDDITDKIQISLDNIDKIASLTQNSNVKNIDKNLLDNIINVTQSIANLTNAASQINKTDVFTTVVPQVINSINYFADQLDNVVIVDNKVVKNFNNLLNSLSAIRISKSPVFPKDFEPGIRTIANTIIPLLEDLAPALDNFKQYKITDLQLSVLKVSNLLTNLSSIQPLSQNKKFSIRDIDDLHTLSTAMPDVVSIGNLLKNFDPPTTDVVQNVSIMLKSLSKVNFEHGQKIDRKGLRDILRVMPEVFEIIKGFDQQLTKKGKQSAPDYKELTRVVVQTSLILKTLEEMRFEGKNTLNKEGLIRVDEALGKVLPIIATLSGAPRSKDIRNVVVISQNIVKMLGYLDEFKFIGDRTINKDKLEELLDVVPLIVKISKIIESVKINNAAKNMRKMIQVISQLANIDTDQFENKDYTGVATAIATIINLSELSESFNPKTVSHVGSMSDFIQRLIVDADSPLQLLSSVELEEVYKKLDDLQKLSKVIKSISETATMVGIIGTMTPLIKPGIIVLQSFMKDMVGIVNVLDGDIGKKIEAAQKIMKSVIVLIACSAICMLIGGFLVVRNPELIVGALAFGLALGLFLKTVLHAIVSNKDLINESLETMKGIALLIVASTFVMILGAAFVVYNPKLVIGAFAFAIALGVFIALTLGAINLATRGIQAARVNLQEVGVLIVASAFVMMLGAVFMLASPKLVAAAFKFTIVLGTFILATMVAINLGTQGMKRTEGQLKQLGILVVASTFVMILGAIFVTTFPRLVAGAFEFTVVLGLFIFATLGAINLGTRGINHSQKQLREFSIIIGVSAAILLIGGGLFMKYPELSLWCGLFTLTLSLFILGVSKALQHLSKIERDLIKGAAAMAIIAGVVVIAASSLLIIKNAVKDGVGNIALGAALMTGMMLAFGGMAAAAGLIASNPFFWIGIGAIAAISAIILITATSLLVIAKAMKTLSDVKKLDFSPLMDNIWGFIKVAVVLSAAMIPVAYVAIPMTIATYAICNAISNISETIKEVAELKIPVYAGTKKIGYRHLTKNDFKSASENISLLITTLSGAICKVFWKNPLLWALGPFSPIMTVVNVSSKMGAMISKIAQGVKNYASMKIPVYNGTKQVGWHHLSRNDYKNAGKNVQDIISVLSNALIELYNKNPQVYRSDSLFSNSAKNTPLARVIAVTSKLGSLISSVAHGVQSYADLKIPIDWNKEGKPIKFKQLVPDDWIGAKDNIKEIIKTYSDALISLYNENKEMYTDTSDFSGWGQSAGNTPLARVIAVTAKLGSLISSIAHGVQSVGNLTIPIKWNKDGKPINFKQMKSDDIDSAAENIITIVSTYSNALIELYHSNETLYTDSGLFNGKLFGSDPGNTPLARVIAVTSKIGKLISNIAHGVQAVGNLTIPIDWDKEGKPKKLRNMTSEDMMNASNNVQSIVTTMSTALMTVYQDHNEWFNNGGIGGWFSGGGDGSSSPFARVLGTSMKLSKLVSGIGGAVGKIAKLQIPNEWDHKTGKVTSYETLSPKHFDLASQNIVAVVTTMANALLKPDIKKKLNDGDFEDVLENVIKMSGTISNIASGVKDFAKLQIPTKWNENGKAVEFITLKDLDFQNAITNIGTIIASIATGIYDGVKNNDLLKEAMTNGGLFKGESTFGRIMNATHGLGELISGIASGMASMAKLQIPNQWDSTGKPIHFTTLSTTDFDAASKNIQTLISNIADSVLQTYKKNPKLFDKADDDGTTFNRIATSCASLGDMISNIADGITTMSEIAGKVNYKTASENIQTVIQTLGQTIIDIYKDPKNTGMFDLPKKSRLDKVLSFFSLSKETDNLPDNPFTRVINSCILMGTMIESISGGIKQFGELDKTIDFKSASTNIATVITTIGNAIISLGDNKLSKDNIEKINSIIDSVKGAANSTSTVADIVKKLSTGTMPVLDDKGNQTGTRKIQASDLTAAASQIKNILTTVYNGIEDAYKEITDKHGNIYSNKFDNLIKIINSGINVIGNNMKTMAQLASGKVTILNASGEKIESVSFTQNQFKAASGLISDSLTTITDGLFGSYKAITDKYPDLLNSADNNPLTNMVNITQSAISMVAKNMQMIAQLGNGKFEVSKDKTIDVSQEAVTKGVDIIKNSITSLLTSFSQLDSQSQAIFGTGTGEGSSAVISRFNTLKTSTTTLGDIIVFLHKVGSGTYKDVKNISEASINKADKIISPMLDNIDKLLTHNYSVLSQKDEDNSKINHIIVNLDKTKGLFASLSNLSETLPEISQSFNEFKLPDKFKSQTQDIANFIKTFDDIKPNIESIDALTKLLHEFTKLGINMANLDKLTNAFSNKLAPTFKNLDASVQKLSKLMQEDGKRKAKHKDEIKSSVTTIKELMNQTMNVVVKMDDSNVISGGGQDSNNDTGNNSNGGGVVNVKGNTVNVSGSLSNPNKK